MFDGPTTAGVDFTAPLVVVDLSAVYHSPPSARDDVRGGLASVRSGHPTTAYAAWW
jgi:hypothetical protein